MRKKFLFALLLAIVAGVSFSIVRAQEVPENRRLELITQLAARLLSQHHYRQQPLDEKMSSQVFDEYFRVLDPNKIYFTQGDVEQFEPQRLTLAAAMSKGNTDFAFQVYQVFLKRFNEFQDYAEAELKKPFDFTVDETFTPDRRELPRAADEAELRDIWRARLKNDVLYFKLIQRSMTENGSNGESADEKQQIRQLWERQSPEEKVLKRLHDLKNYFLQRKKVDILSIFLSAAAQVYGPHSGYLSPKLDQDFNINMKLSLFGIGATLTSDDGYIRVVSLVPGGPAAMSGQIQVEDRIIAVAQERGEPVDVIDMSVDNAVELIRGPEGTKVTLTILPGKKGRNAVPENVTLTRAKIELKESEAKGEIKTVTRADGSVVRIGVISLPSFYMDFEAFSKGNPNFKSCSRDVKNLLEGFEKEKIDAVVIDLRNNGGGSLAEAVNLTGLFISTGPVVQVRQADRRVLVERDEDAGISYAGPLVILTSKFSASAAEIFAGAIKDYRRGLVVGDSRTFGKGTVLNMIDLKNMLRYIGQDFEAGSLRLETAMFFRVNGESVQQLGIRPDIALPSLTDQMEVGEMFSENHLPWDSIAEQSYRYYDQTLPEKIPRLRLNSEKRIAADPEYSKLIRRIEVFNEQNNRKTISLNEEKRWEEYQRNKTEAELNEKELEAMEQGPQPAVPDKKNPAETIPENPVETPDSDPILREAANIAADLAAIE